MAIHSILPSRSYLPLGKSSISSIANGSASAFSISANCAITHLRGLLPALTNLNGYQIVGWDFPPLTRLLKCHPHRIGSDEAQEAAWLVPVRFLIINLECMHQNSSCG